MAKSGHHFPAGVFTHSSGKKQSVKGYTRAVPKKATGGMIQRPVGMSGPKMIPQAQPGLKPAPRAVMSSPKTPPMQIRQAPIMRNTQPVRGGGALAYAEGGFVREGDATLKTETIGDQGNAVVKRGKPPFSEADSEYGGTGSLRTGYKKGGTIKKGAPPFKKGPLFGKK